VGCDATSGNDSGNGIAWLRQRMENMQIGQCVPELIDHAWHQLDNSANPDQRQQLLARIDSGIERIVIASVNRLDYPFELIEWLQRVCPEVPLALACDSWWDGWRRTGLKSRLHLSLPWYRWWDGWVDWLQGRTLQLYEPAPVDWCLLTDAPHAHSLATNPPLSRGLIVGNCRQTLAAWKLAAEASGYSADSVSEQAYQQQVQDLLKSNDKNRAAFTPQWILWDDSCLDTTPTVVTGRSNDSSLGVSNDSGTCQTNQPDDQAIHKFLEQLPTLLPTEPPSDSSQRILGIVAVSLPRADWALRLCSTPGRELLVKPNSGQGLTRLLDHYYST
ncbi:MAG: hypothetical protein ABI557_12260, partial [Aureliella sp.]